jgi:hypothetical protein
MGASACNLNGLVSRPGTRTLKHQAHVSLTFYPHDIPEPLAPKRSAFAIYVNKSGGGSDAAMTAFRWSKQLGEISGHWSATLKIPPTSSLDILGGDILPGDWVDATVTRNGVEFPLMRGVVDTVRENKIESQGATILAFNLTGRDHGAPFETPIVYANIWATSSNQKVKGLITEAIKGVIGGSPTEMFAALINAAFGAPDAPQWLMPWSVAGRSGRRFIDMLSIEPNPTRYFLFNQFQLWTQPGDDLSTLMTQWCNPLFNEWIMDLASRDSVDDPWLMRATLRERPFINRVDGMKSSWFALPVLELPDWAINATDLGRSLQDRFNLFEVIQEFGMASDDQYAVAQPSWNRQSVDKYGLRPMMQTTKYSTEGGFGAWRKVRMEIQDLLVDWHATNPYWISGTTGIRLALPELHVGELFRITTGDSKKDRTLLVEGIDFTWQWTSPHRAPASQTNLVLTRGYEGSGNKALDIVNQTAKLFTSIA